MLKMLLIGVAGIGFIGGAVMIFQLVRAVDDFEFERSRADAELYVEATAADDALCLDKALADLADCSAADVACQIGSFVFFDRCRVLAEHSPELCTEVPDGLVAMGLWTLDSCPRSDVSPELCERFMRKVAQECAKAREDSTGSSSPIGAR